MLQSRKFGKFFLLLALIMLIISGCGGNNDEEEAAAEAEADTAGAVEGVDPGPTPTTSLAPTLGAGLPATATLPPPAEEAGGDDAVSSGDGGTVAGGPTALPEPTQIPPADAGSGEAGPTPIGPQGTGPGISINPQIGMPLDATIVNGSGFVPGEEVTFHWATESGPTGPEYWSEIADSDGNVNVGLLVPAGVNWPGGEPTEDGDIIQLRAIAPSLDGGYYWANFTFVARFDAVTSLIQTYINTNYGYELDLPDQWTWQWEGEDGDDFDVRFYSGTGDGWGFARITLTTDVDKSIAVIMPLEAPGASYTTEALTGASYPGKKVTTDSGMVVWFIPANGRTYVLSFTKDDGTVYDLILNSFRLS